MYDEKGKVAALDYSEKTLDTLTTPGMLVLMDKSFNFIGGSV